MKVTSVDGSTTERIRGISDVCSGRSLQAPIHLHALRCIIGKGVVKQRLFLCVATLATALFAVPTAAEDVGLRLRNDGVSSRTVPPRTSDAGRAAERQAGRSQPIDSEALATPASPRGADPVASEFQKFVLGATGRLLPMYGARIFADDLGSFGRTNNLPVASDHAVSAGDEIIIHAWGSIDLDFRGVVDRNGQLSVPQVGSFIVAGVKARDLDRRIRAQLARLYNNFDLSVSLGSLRPVRVFVVGAET